MAIKADSATLDDALARTKELSAAIDRAMAESTKVGAQSIQVAAMTKAPVYTGRLRRSINSKTVAITGHVEAVVEATAPYASYVEHGTGVYGPRGQPIIYGRMIRIPLRDGTFRSVFGIMGMKAKPYMRPAWDARISAVVLAVKDAIAKVVTLVK